MKKIFLLTSLILLSIFTLFAQAPEMFKYQAVVRNNSGEVIKNQNVALKISILQGSANGTVVYSETHHNMTNEFGLVNLEIGNGVADIGSFPLIDWQTGLSFVKIELDVSNGNNFTTMGTSQLLSVPYALYANKAESLNLSSSPSDGDILFYNSENWTILTKGTEGQVLKTVEGFPKWYAAELPVLPIATTNPVTEIMQTSAVSGGLAMANGNTEITARGMCWSLTQNPTINDSVTNDGTGLGDFTSTLTGLTAGTTYYARAYATNSSGTSYGNQVTFKTVLTVVFPTVTTSAAINITENSALSGGNVTATGGAEIMAKGICWSTNQNPTVADSKTDEGTDFGQFNSQLENLIPGSVYYVRAYATNIAGTGYGAQVTLTTLKTIPTVITKNVSSITAMGGVSGGTITITGGGTISDKGTCWGETENPTIYDNKISAGTGIAAFNSAISLLKPNTTCYVRAYAVNEIGIAYGDQKTFTTLDAFYDGFETGFSGTTGGWGIVMGDAVEGAYSLYTNKRSSEASLTRTLTNSGQFAYYVKVSEGDDNITFYIDNVIQGAYSNTFWGLQSYPVTAGEHTFKWIFNCDSYDNNGWIDFIVMPK